MNFKGFVKVATSFISKNSPYILSGTGAIAITAGSIVLAKKARKAKDTIDDKVAHDIMTTKYAIENDKIKEVGTEKDYRKKIVKVYTKSAWEYTKYYIAPVMLVAGGVACMFSAMLIQTKRLRIMSAAYTALAASFNEYRDRVRAVVGDEKEEDIFKGVVRDEKGNIVSENPIDAKYLDGAETFSRLFGDGNSVFWSKDTRLCVLTLQGAESNLNQLLREQGFVTLNDVWKELGMRPSEEGMYLGWRWKYGDPIYGETYINLGFSGPKNQNRVEELKHGWNEEFWIDLVPPHSLFGKLPKEIKRSNDDKSRILANRRKVVTE